MSVPEHPPPPTARLRDLTGQPELLVAMVILVAFIALASLQVITRYLLNQQFVWTEELSATLLIWLTFLGAAAIERDNGHVRLQTVDEMVPPRIGRWIYTVYDLVVLFWLGCLVWAGYRLLGQLNFEMTPALKIPFRYVLVIVPAAAALSAVYVVRNMIRRFLPQGAGDGR